MRRIDLRSALVAAIAAATLALVPLSAAAASTPGDDLGVATVGLLPRAADPTPAVDDEPAASAEPTPEPSAPDTTPASPEPTVSATPTPTPTEEPTTSAPTSASAQATSATPSESADADTGLTFPVGLPVLLGFGALLAAIGALGWLLAGAARKRSWDAALDVERVQAQWVAEELVPALADETTPVHELVGHWSAAQPTLDQLQTNLAALASEAPDDRRAASVAAMSTASAEVRSAAAALLSLAGGTIAEPGAVGGAREALRSASAQLIGASIPRR